MQIGDILTLEFNEKYLLINKVNYEKKDYFLAIGVSEKEDDLDLDDIAFFEIIEENDEKFVKEVLNQELLDKLADASMLSTMSETKKVEKILEEYYNNKEDS